MGVRVVFARHGESVANVEGVISNRDLPHALTARGREQAAQLADRLRAERVVGLYCSPILRARETALIVGTHLGLRPIEVDGLREPDCGVLEGRTDPQAWRQHDELTQRWLTGDLAARAEAGESLDDVVARLRALLALLAQRHGHHDATVLCITHGALLLTALPVALVEPSPSRVTKVVGPTGTVEVEYSDGRWRARRAANEAPSPSPGVDGSASSR